MPSNMPTGPSPYVVWLTGLSGAGKTTLAHRLKNELAAREIPAVVLDGDEIRSGLCRDLAFSASDRSENARRVAEVAKLCLGQGWVAIVALISPARADRQLARAIIGKSRFVEVYCECPLAVCEARDVKGLYRQAREGALLQFTGISSGYECPVLPDVVLSTGKQSIDGCMDTLMSFIAGRGSANPSRP